MTRMKKIATSGLAALTMCAAVGATLTPASAWWRGGWGGPGPFVGGLAAGAILGGALAPRYYYPPAAYGPAYAYGGSCVRRVWGPYGWRWARYC